MYDLVRYKYNTIRYETQYFVIILVQLNHNKFN